MSDGSMGPIRTAGGGFCSAFPLSAIRNPQSDFPALWVEVYHGRLLAAAFVDAQTAIRCAGIFGREACIVIDPQLREQWLADDRAVATVEEFPAHPSRAEQKLCEMAGLADLLCMPLTDGRLVLWYRDARPFAVFPPDVKLACMAEIGGNEQ